MRPLELLLRAQSRARAPWVAAAFASAFGAAFACRSQPADIHESADVKGTPCISCHAAAYSAAENPVHVNQMPQTCQDCHSTNAWVPSKATNHPWWPLQNKHVGVSCVTCHSKGFKVGDTSSDCVGCHQKDYDAVPDPKHKDLFPLDCATCHTDAGFKPSSFTHDSWPLVGRHSYRITACSSCHPGAKPDYKAASTDCYTCHKDAADNLAPSKNPSHPTFPHTCLDCHLMSGWTQGPPLAGLHLESGFPIKTGVHSDPRIACMDCHKLEKGLAAGGANTDCVNCHTGAVDHHTEPSIDALHLKTADGGTVANYPQGASATNFCLQCHSHGQHL